MASVMKFKPEPRKQRTQDNAPSLPISVKFSIQADHFSKFPELDAFKKVKICVSLRDEECGCQARHIVGSARLSSIDWKRDAVF